ncbi:MAG: hypothetical protein ACI81R_001962 [Bradymonadia bacterium]|jgi:hypothetical protein
MIHPYTNENVTLWGHGKFQVQLELPGNTKPMGWCDGTSEDEAEIRTQAEGEGVEDLKIHKKQLKSGRQIWTLGEMPTDSGEEEW